MIIVFDHFDRFAANLLFLHELIHVLAALSFLSGLRYVDLLSDSFLLLILAQITQATIDVNTQERDKLEVK